ncbi:uracil-DNA glycosylase [Glycocaulis sp.]
MYSLTPPQATDPRRAMNSLIGWWEDAGIETDIPVLPPAASRTAPAARTQAPSAARSQPAAKAPLKPRQDARAMAAGADSVEALKAVLEQYEGCALRFTATNTVFARGNPAAPLMVIGEGPGAEEDRQGAPFVGRSGQLLDRMLGAIGLDDTRFHITNVVYWRPPGNRKPSSEEIEACRPFVERHIAIVKPRVILLAGGIAAQSLLNTPQGIMALRGRWGEISAGGHTAPALPTFHPAFLLRRPQEKAKAWADMLSLAEKLEELG